MLKSEIARERLKAFANPDWYGHCQTRIAQLPEPLRHIIAAILAPDDRVAPLANAEERKRSREACDMAFRLLSGLPSGQRQEIFTALFPAIGSYIEAAWQLFSRLPYRLGGIARSFRIPVLSDSVRAAQTSWLTGLIVLLHEYAEQDIQWFATWAGYIANGNGDALGYIFAAAIEQQNATGTAVYDILIASANGEHEIGAFGRHVTRALLVANRPDGWEYMEKMFLAAQRQEGLRQVILESIDEAHLAAFRRMLRLIRDHELVRFSAVIRAVDIWFGFQYDSLNARQANQTITQVLNYLEDADSQEEALAHGDANAAYLALWSMAIVDATEAVAPAAALLYDDNVERRFVGAYILSLMNLPASREALLIAMEDSDLRVAWQAVANLNIGEHYSDYTGSKASHLPEDMFERLERLAARIKPKAEELAPIAWPWMKKTVTAGSLVSYLIASLGDRSPKRLLPYLPLMEVYGRARMVDLLTQVNEPDAEIRDLMLQFAADPTDYVRAKAFKALESSTIASQEAVRLEKLLTRKSADLRQGVQKLLLTQPDPEAIASAQRLLAVTNAPQRAAGLDLLQQMLKHNRSADAARQAVQHFQHVGLKKTDSEEKLIAQLLDTEREAPTLKNGLGLFDPTQRTPGTPPAKQNVPLMTRAAIECMKSLDAWIERHKETPVSLKTGGGREEILLGNMQYQFPYPPRSGQASGMAVNNAANQTPTDVEAERSELPLRALWEQWLSERPDELRDADGLELLRARLLEGYRHGAYTLSYTFNYRQPADQTPAWMKSALAELYGEFPDVVLIRPHLLSRIVGWLLYLHEPEYRPADSSRLNLLQRPMGQKPSALPEPCENRTFADFLLDAFESCLALVPQEEVSQYNDQRRFSWRGNSMLMPWLQVLRAQRTPRPEAWSAEQNVRLYRLLRWLDEPAPDLPRLRPLFSETLAAYDQEAANAHDILDHLVGPLSNGPYPNYSAPHDLQQLSGRTLPPWTEKYPFLPDMIARVRRRILEVELARGDSATAATPLAHALRWSGGAETLVQILQMLGAEGLARTSGSSADSKANTFSHLVRVTYPLKTDTARDFARSVRETKISEKRLVELALFAPQWASFVEQTLGWSEFSEAVWWIHAHTKDQQWGVAQELRDEWIAQSNERTPLSAQSLLDGAVDVAWFGRVYAALGEERWKWLDEAAKYASGGGGHKRAQLYADAMLGRLEKTALIARIKDKRSQDAVRALGLIPLAEGESGQKDALERYKTVQEFVRTSKQFGAQRQASEKMAASIALENLARTSDYPDPARLEWAMEANAVADLANGPLTVRVGEVGVSLSITPLGKPDIVVTKRDKHGQEKPLKTVPPAVKKNAEVAALYERKKEIERQHSRMRNSLEQAMCRGDRFTAGELEGLLTHPVLAPMLRSLVFVAAAAQQSQGEMATDRAGLPGEIKALGYPVPHTRRLQSLDDSESALDADTVLRIAHPYDLLNSGNWSEWQRDCFLRERVQPFKQVFRELYVLTEAEADESNLSRRYDGHQLNPRQALALLGTRGWIASGYEGDARRTFHDSNITACLNFFEGFTTPAEVEGLTIHGIHFTKRGEWQALPLTQVPPRVFSEAMRDLDLVVSVAHQGGIDPEASASTVEMRATLLQETCRLLNLDNVRLKGSHALIDGELGTYSVHLGSAVVHRQPGGALCIVPVHSQHRGRLFLPFADDDPKTAEVLSKVLLLAKDTQIKDPIILEQLLVAT